MRTTLNLEPDAFRAAKAKADYEKLSLGQAVSELILQALQATTPRRASASGTFRSEGGLYTSEQVEEALDDE